MLVGGIRAVSGKLSNEPWRAGGCCPGSATAGVRASSELGGSRSTESSGVAGVGRGSISAPDGE